MSIDFENTELTELTPKIAVIGVGGAGCNAVNNMIAANLQGVDFVVANTDAQALANSHADNRLQLGVQITQGLGAGAQPKVGQAAAEEVLENIDETLEGCHMAFVTAGMGGGTGTGAAPVIARRAREKGILTVGVVTKPFQFEGGRRMKIADVGIQELAGNVDTLIIIPNQNLFLVANEKTTFADAFNMADEVLHSGVRGITDLMVMPGLINLDFADVRTVMSEMGKAMMGTGEASGETRAADAAAAAISNPLLEEASLKGAKGVIINVTGGMDMTLYEVDEAVNMVRDLADEEALIVFGSAFSQELEGKLRVSVVATGIEGGAGARPIPQKRERIEIQSATMTVDVQTDTKASVAASGEAEQAGAQDETAETGAETSAASGAASGAGTEAGQASELHEDQEDADHALEDALISGDLLDLSNPNRVEEAEVVSEATDTVAEATGDVAPAEQLEEKALSQQNDTFVAEAPMMPKSAMMPEMAPTPEAKSWINTAPAEDRTEAHAEAQVETRSEAPMEQPDLLAKKPAPQKRSLFQLMTGGMRPTSEEAKREDATEAANKASSKASNDAKTGAVSLGGVSQNDRPAPSASADQLEIPSFLRRQQN